MSSSHDLLNLKASKKAYAIFILETATTFKGTKTWKFYNASVRGLHLQQKYFVYRTWNLYFIRLKKIQTGFDPRKYTKLGIIQSKMRTFHVDSKDGLNILQTKLRRPTFLSTCANKTKGWGSLHLVEG